MRHRRSIIVRLVAMAALLVPTSIVLGASPAAADTVDLSCTGTQSASYSPGLTLTSRTVTASGSGSFSCPVSADPTLTGGAFTISPFTYTGTCGLTANSNATFTYAWNNGRTSTVQVNVYVYSTLGVVVATSVGPVIAGEFLGDTFAFTWTAMSPSPADCLTATGVTQYAGPITLTMTSL
ncbi:hypothetical protein F4553_000222 [Allocatelliglobosispora scoriae]|uniref:Ig-like domain-containing protein n=1 Tax=Allocatelliglobosispora scoriae TaxID=643052 RepID=A0A841BIF2_9ACTN|nr:hypothetical protein [Allocatelliglobosispora scoriae]MBB5866843.1 hypothetical protein [Allocatelliglobosispora scoriae]